MEESKKFSASENIEDIYSELQATIKESDTPEGRKLAEEMIGKLNDIWLIRDRNPLVKVEEMEEQNYNQIDGALSNTSLDKGLVIQSEEAPLLHGHDDYFGIYQLKSSDDTIPYRFENLQSIRERGLSVEKSNYDLVYQDKLQGETLDKLFERFNIDRPDDFKGHSLSLSDIVVIRKEDETKSYYVDSFGFAEIKDFYQQAERDKTEVAYSLPMGYMAIENCDEGYDYNFYERDYKMIDGGVLENNEITITEAAKEVIIDAYGEVPFTEVDYEELIEKVEEKNAIEPNKKELVEKADDAKGEKSAEKGSLCQKLEIAKESVANRQSEQGQIGTYTREEEL